MSAMKIASVIEQIQDTQDEYNAAIAEGDEVAAAGAADMYATLRRWGHTMGVDTPPLHVPVTRRGTKHDRLAFPSR